MCTFQGVYFGFVRIYFPVVIIAQGRGFYNINFSDIFYSLNAKVNSGSYTLTRFISVTDSYIMDNAVCLLERSYLCLMKYILKNI